MRFAEHLTAHRAWCTRCLPGGVLRSMAMHEMSTPHPPPWTAAVQRFIIRGRKRQEKNEKKGCERKHANLLLVGVSR